MSVATENAQAGSPSTEWEIFQAGDLTNLGFCRQFSVNVGETAQFSCSGTGTVIDIYRMGYYSNATGFRKVATLTNTATAQPAPATVPNTNGGTTCTAWSTTATWAVPSNAESGLYVGVYRNGAGNNASYIPFVVRNDAADADIIYLTSDATWALAYNNFGSMASPMAGSNWYGTGTGVGNIVDRCHYATYHKPIITRQSVPQTYFMACEYPLIRWLERNGYNVKYVTSKDLDRYGTALLAKGKILLASGHSEYWSGPMRTAVETWRDNSAGRSIFMAANEVFWKIRYTGTNRDEAYCFKDTMPGPGSHGAGQPLDPVDWTGTWKDTRWANRKPEWLLTGTDFRMNGINDFDATIVKNPYGGHPAWGNTALVDQDITLAKVIGFEADSVRPTQPTGSHKLLAVVNRNINGAYADDNGQTYTGNGDLTWGIVSQRYGGGGVTVGLGTCQWSWQLDANHDRGSGTPTSLAAQQFTLNLLADFGAQPVTRMTGLVARTPVSLDEYGFDPGQLVTDPGSGLKLGDGTALALKTVDGTTFKVSVVP